MLEQQDNTEARQNRFSIKNANTIRYVLGILIVGADLALANYLWANLELYSLLILVPSALIGVVSILYSALEIRKATFKQERAASRPKISQPQLNPNNDQSIQPSNSNVDSGPRGDNDPRTQLLEINNSQLRITTGIRPSRRTLHRANRVVQNPNHPQTLSLGPDSQPPVEERQPEGPPAGPRKQNSEIKELGAGDLKMPSQVVLTVQAIPVANSASSSSFAQRNSLQSLSRTVSPPSIKIRVDEIEDTELSVYPPFFPHIVSALAEKKQLPLMSYASSDYSPIDSNPFEANEYKLQEEEQEDNLTNSISILKETLLNKSTENVETVFKQIKQVFEFGGTVDQHIEPLLISKLENQSFITDILKSLKHAEEHGELLQAEVIILKELFQKHLSLINSEVIQEKLKAFSTCNFEDQKDYEIISAFTSDISKLLLEMSDDEQIIIEQLRQAKQDNLSDNHLKFL